MNWKFEENDATLFVDASNAFNNLNHHVSLANIQTVCPILAPVLINTYISPGLLFAVHFSREGTTQGDPLGMAMYAIGM